MSIKEMFESPIERDTISERLASIERLSGKLYYAVVFRDIEMAREALKDGADPNLLGEASLRNAVESGSVEFTEMLLDHGAEIPDYDSKPRNTIDCGFFDKSVDYRPYKNTGKSNKELAKLLVDELGFKIENPSPDKRPLFHSMMSDHKLFHATMSDHKNVLRLLLEEKKSELATPKAKNAENAGIAAKIVANPDIMERIDSRREKNDTDTSPAQKSGKIDQKNKM